MQHLSRAELVAVAAVVAAGLMLRILPLPYSAGSDLAQFAGFADTFLRHSLCFYSFADALHWTSEGWPYNWPYIYGPIWVAILAAIRCGVNSEVVTTFSGNTYKVYIPMDWALAVKSVIVVFDVASAILLYILVRRYRSWLYAVTALAAYFLNPVTIYVSAIYGMFDPVALAPLLGSLLLVRKNSLASGALAAISVLTKQMYLLPAATILLGLALFDRKAAKPFTAGALLASLAALLPFALACPQSVPHMIDLALYSASTYYVRPLPYSFNGISSLATYLHDYMGIDAMLLINMWYVPFGVLYALVVVYLLRSRNYVAAACLSYVVFTAAYWRVNYQYFVGLTALLIILISSAELRCLSRFSAAAVIALAASWVFMYPISWWFRVHVASPNYEAISILDKLSLHILDFSAYVPYALALTILQYILICSAACLDRADLTSRGLPRTRDADKLTAVLSLFHSALLTPGSEIH